MNLFGLEGSGFIIAVGLTLLMAGIIIYYVNARLKGLQANLDKQGSVLSQLITATRAHVGGGAPNMATPEAEAAAMQQMAQASHDARIEVSDDSEDSEEYDSDSEDDEDATEGGNDAVIVKNVEIRDDAGADDPVSIQVNNISSLEVIEAIHDSTPPEQGPSSDDSLSEDEDSDGVSPTQGDILETLDSNMMGTIKINKLEDPAPSIVELMEQASNVDESDIKAMRVNQLRDLAITKKQVPESEAKTMKKPELIQLLLSQ